MMNATTVSVRISREELAALLALLETPSLPGLGEDLLGGLNEEERALLLAAGRHSLVARGWVEEQPAEDGAVRLVFDPTLLALVGECSQAGTVTLVNRYGPQPPPAAWYIHHGAHLRVIHRLVASGVHEFVGTVEVSEIEAAVRSLFPFAAHSDVPGNGAAENRAAGNGTSGAAGSFRLAQAALDTAIAEVREGDTPAAEAALAAAGASAASARQFAAALRDVEANSMLARLDLAAASAGDSSSALAFSLVESPGSAWMLRPGEDGDEEMLHVEPVDGPGFAAWLQRLLC